MKNLILLILINASFFQTFSQTKLSESAVPSAVRSKFSALYPSTKVDFWGKENNNYVAEFNRSKKEMIAIIDPSGNVVREETRIATAALPAEAKTYISKHFPGHKVTDAVSSTDRKGNMVYEAEVDEQDLIFDAKGGFIKSVKERPID